ncbi:MAG: hypothetical protein V4722_22310 [Bacteroidota bacterium]
MKALLFTCLLVLVFILGSNGQPTQKAKCPDGVAVPIQDFKAGMRFYFPKKKSFFPINDYLPGFFQTTPCAPDTIIYRPVNYSHLSGVTLEIDSTKIDSARQHGPNFAQILIFLKDIVCNATYKYSIVVERDKLVNSSRNVSNEIYSLVGGILLSEVEKANEMLVKKDLFYYFPKGAKKQRKVKISKVEPGTWEAPLRIYFEAVDNDSNKEKKLDSSIDVNITGTNVLSSYRIAFNFSNFFDCEKEIVATKKESPEPKQKENTTGLPGTIRLNDSLSGEKTPHEFSSMAIHPDGSVLLIPTLKNPANGYKPSLEIYAVSPTEIDKALADSKYTVIHRPISFDTKSFKKYISSKRCYDGIEATVVVGNDIYFAIETNNKQGCGNCFLAKGHFNNEDGKIYIDNSVAIKKPGYDFNDDGGFESLTFFNNALLMTFEYKNTATGEYLAHLTDLELRKLTPETAGVKSQIKKRLTETYYDDATKNIYGLLSQPNNYEIVTVPAYTIKPLLNHLSIANLNWEGLVRYKQGFLLINDNDNSGGKNIERTSLVYIPDPHLVK